MHYTIYKITNLINSKFYIGKHETLNPYDSYMGSGIALQRAIKKYGCKNFRKQILFNFSSRKEMDIAERILVVIDHEVSYNLGRGGEGGPLFQGRKHSNETKRLCGEASKRTIFTDERREQLRVAALQRWKDGKLGNSFQRLGASQKIFDVCPICNNEFERWKNNSKRIFCSHKCANSRKYTRRKKFIAG